MSSYRWDELDPFTQRQIELQPWDTGYGTNPPALRTCGCEVLGEAWRLCQYHEGVDDGASEVRAEVWQLTAELAQYHSDHMAHQNIMKKLAEDNGEWMVRCEAAEAREAKLRAIPEQLADDQCNVDKCLACLTLRDVKRLMGEVT